MNTFQSEINKCIEVLKAGGTILYPTDTIWGIGCDATNEVAVRKIFSLKNRDDAKSVIVLLANENQLTSYVQQVPDQAYQLIEYANKPLTIIYPVAKNLASNTINVDGSIGIRIPKDDFCQQLLNKFRRPLVSTSANISGEPSPSNFSEIDSSIIRGVDYVVNLRQNENSKSTASTIIKLGLKGEIQIIRK
jgi:L-threonylcarbamoyladenylate synthase